MDTKGLLLEDEDKVEEHGLVDHDSNFVVPVMILGGIAVMVLLALGIFLPTGSWIW